MSHGWPPIKTVSWTAASIAAAMPQHPPRRPFPLLQCYRRNSAGEEIGVVRAMPVRYSWWMRPRAPEPGHRRLRNEYRFAGSAGHKGCMACREPAFCTLREGVEVAPLLVGGSGSHSIGADQPVTLPERFESGTLNTPGIAGLKAGVDFIRETGLDAIRAKEQALVGQLLEGLQRIPGTVIHGPHG